MFNAEGRGTNNWFSSACLLIPLVVLISGSFASVNAKERIRTAGYPWQLEVIDSNRQDFDLSSYQGKTLLLSFFYTTCGFACPIQTARLASVQQLLKPEALAGSRFVSVSIHPELDKPKRVDAFVRPFNVDQNHWQFGTPKTGASLNQLLEQAGIKAIPESGSDQIDHTMKILLIDPAGKVMQRYVGNKFQIERVAKDVDTLVRLRKRS